MRYDSRRDSSAPSTTPETGVPVKCPVCHSSSISTSAKTPDASSYWRCGPCGEIWNAGRHHAPRRQAYPWR